MTHFEVSTTLWRFTVDHAQLKVSVSIGEDLNVIDNYGDKMSLLVVQ